MYTDALIKEYELNEAVPNYADQERKMIDWHNGRRKQGGFSTMTPEKYQMNYDICIKHGFTKEANILVAEATNHGIKLKVVAPQNQPSSSHHLLSFSINDFHPAGATFVKDHFPNVVIQDAMTSTGTIKNIVIDLIYALILKLSNSIDTFKNFLLNNAGMSAQELKTYINNILADKAIVERLNDIKKTLMEALEEDVEKHDILNPKLWNEDNTLKPEVEEKINAIVDNFLDGLKENDINYKLDDVKLVGSNCSYNYNSKSDLDLHLFFDLSIYDDVEKQEMAEMIYNYNRKFWNDAHDIKFYDIPVEIFAETTNTIDLTNDGKEKK